MNLLSELKDAVKNDRRIVIQYHGSGSDLTVTGVLDQFYLAEGDLVLSGPDFSCTLPYGKYQQTEEGYTFQICNDLEAVFFFVS